MDKLEGESKGNDLSRKRLKKLAAVSTDEDRLSKAVRKETSSKPLCSENISVPRCRLGEDEEVEVDHIVWARDVKDSVGLPLVWQNPGVIAYVKLGAKYLVARRSGALPSLGRES